MCNGHRIGCVLNDKAIQQLLLCSRRCKLEKREEICLFYLLWRTFISDVLSVICITLHIQMCKLLSEVRNLNPGEWNICISTGIFVNASDTGKCRLDWFYNVPLAAFLVSYKTNGEVMSPMLMEKNVRLLVWCWCQDASISQLHTSLRQQQQEETQIYQWGEKGGDGGEGNEGLTHHK